MAIALRLSKNGYGSLNEVLNWSSELVLSVLEYDNFTGDLENAFVELNKGAK